MGRFVIDLTTKQFGNWTVLAQGPSSGTSIRWYCKCSCGAVSLVRSAHLKSGASKSCGCALNKGNLKHGGAQNAHSKKYKTWRQIKARCNNPNHKNADIYNGLLCDAWQNFKEFDAYMPEPPSDKHTIDRLDNSKGYEPGNVRWATTTEQHRNQTNCRWIELNGKRQLLTDWAKDLGITPSSLHERLEKWTLEKALSH